MNDRDTTTREPSLTWLALFVVVLFVLAGFVLATTAPIGSLIRTSPWALVGTYHGLAAGLLMIVVSITLYLGYRLFIGQIEAFHHLQWLSVVMATISFLTIVLGNWIYIGYRQPKGVRAFFLKRDPAMHMILFEFKEYIALFTLPLSVAAAYILYRYGAQLRERPWLAATVAILIAMVFVCFMLAFGLGAAITRILPVL